MKQDYVINIFDKTYRQMVIQTPLNIKQFTKMAIFHEIITHFYNFFRK